MGEASVELHPGDLAAFLHEVQHVIEMSDFLDASGVVVQFYDPMTQASRFYGPFPKDNLDVLEFIAHEDTMPTDEGVPPKVSVHYLFAPEPRRRQTNRH